MAKKFQGYEKCKERYNDLMYMVCHEFATIGENLTEQPERKAQWNIRDMVAEVEYVYSTYFESGHVNEELRHGDEDEKKMWKSETGKLKRFIDAFEEEALTYPTTFEHGSEMLYGKFAAPDTCHEWEAEREADVDEEEEVTEAEEVEAQQIEEEPEAETAEACEFEVGKSYRSASNTADPIEVLKRTKMWILVSNGIKEFWMMLRSDESGCEYVYDSSVSKKLRAEATYKAVWAV